MALAFAAAILFVHQTVMRMRAARRVRPAAAPASSDRLAISPPHLFIATLAAGAGLEICFPLTSGPSRPFYWMAIGIGLVIAAEVSMRSASRELKRCATTESSAEGASELASRGPFARSRNPIYAGMLVLYAGIAVAAVSSWALILFPLLFVILHFAVVRREERDLSRRFGARYQAYAATVPRYL